jgi:hypothetical protein
MPRTKLARLALPGVLLLAGCGPSGDLPRAPKPDPHASAQEPPPLPPGVVAPKLPPPIPPPG